MRILHVYKIILILFIKVLGITNIMTHKSLVRNTQVETATNMLMNTNFIENVYDCLDS